jgi:pimeloyl-ACP methyl ester carboxylesterase
MTRYLLAVTLALQAIVPTSVGSFAQAAALNQQEDIQLVTPTGTLRGTLLLPEGGRTPVPVALIIAGSGPTDRDGNTPLLPGKNNSLKQLAEALAKQGVASIRYDKRGVAGSMGAAAGKSETDLRFTTYSDDAAAWIAQARKDPRFSKIIVIGHSEGSLLGMIAARNAKADAFVSLAGAGRPIGDVLADQLGRNLPVELRPEAMRILAELRAGRTVADVPPTLAVVFRPSVQPYLLSWLPLDPPAELAKLQIPVLIVQGSTDVQAGPQDFAALVRVKPPTASVMIDGMNHVLKEVREAAQQTASYSDSSLSLHPGLITALAEFLKTVK